MILESAVHPSAHLLVPLSDLPLAPQWDPRLADPLEVDLWAAVRVYSWRVHQ